MIKFLLVFSFLFSSLALADEHNKSIEVYLGKSKINKLKYNAKSADSVKAVNQHPNFIQEGMKVYKGIFTSAALAKTQFMNGKLPKKAYLIDKSGDYSIEYDFAALFYGENLFAFEKSDKALSLEQRGTQVIFPAKTLEKFPMLKQRNFWCWWVRALVIGTEVPELILRGIETKSAEPWKAPLGFPMPYGNSMFGKTKKQKTYDLKEIVIDKSTTNLKVKILGGTEIDLPIQEGIRYFIKDNRPEESLRLGGNTIFSVKKFEKNRITEFAKNIYYVQSIAKVYK